MKLLLKKIPIFALVILFVISCGKIDSGKIDKEINNDFSILVLSDIHISNDETKDIRLRNLIDSINAGYFKNLDLVVTTGDNVSSFYKDRNKVDGFDNNRAAKFINIIQEVEIPYYIALGNHDYKIDGDKDSDAPFSFKEIDTMEVLWNKFAGLKEPYYSVNHKGWKLILLNSMRGRYLNRSFDDEQMNWIEEELGKNKPTLIFFHHPIKTDNIIIWCKPKDLITETKEPVLFSVLKKYKKQIKGIFVGHGHRFMEDILFGTIPIYETDSFGENKNSPYQLIEIDTTEILIKVTQNELINN
jgi:3',5'-cyclic AMP phosphodiesterase CpdA